MKTTAVLSDDETHYLLSGTKIWISNAGYAGLFTVFAKVAVNVDGVRKERVTAVGRAETLTPSTSPSECAGSVDTTRTRPREASATARAAAHVVLPTPPFPP